VRNLAKALVLTLATLALSAALGHLALKGLERGYVIVGKYKGLIVTQAESPVAFYLSILVLGLASAALLWTAAFLLLSRGERRAALLRGVRSPGVRPSIFWFLMVSIATVFVLVLATRA
jgi:hypothetical protein